MTDDRYMTLKDVDVLNDDNTVGVVEEIEYGDATVEFSGEEHQISVKLRDDTVGDDDTHLFISCDGGELNVGYGPEFAPIETNLTIGQANTALGELPHYRYSDFDIVFDHRGPVVFRGDDVTAVTTPMKFDWHKPQPERPRTAPQGPRMRGGGDET